MTACPPSGTRATGLLAHTLAHTPPALFSGYPSSHEPDIYTATTRRSSPGSSPELLGIARGGACETPRGAACGEVAGGDVTSSDVTSGDVAEGGSVVTSGGVKRRAAMRRAAARRRAARRRRAGRAMGGDATRNSEVAGGDVTSGDVTSGDVADCGG